VTGSVTAMGAWGARVGRRETLQLPARMAGLVPWVEREDVVATVGGVEKAGRAEKAGQRETAGTVVAVGMGERRETTAPREPEARAVPRVRRAAFRPRSLDRPEEREIRASARAVVDNRPQ
jgi:hypothetical protein